MFMARSCSALIQSKGEVPMYFARKASPSGASPMFSPRPSRPLSVWTTRMARRWMRAPW